MPATIDRALRVFVCFVGLTVVANATFADDDSAPKEAVLFRALDQRVSVDFKDMPIDRAVSSLIKMTPGDQISLAFDDRSLAEANIDLDTKVTLLATDIRLSSALDFVLGQANAAWTIRDEMLQVTSRKVAAGQVLLFSHDVTALMIREELADRPCRYLQLIDVITRAIAPETWSARGGAGSIERYGQNEDLPNHYTMLVRQTPAIHLEIRRLIAGLHPQSAAEKKILAALDQPTDFEFVEAPLTDVIGFLRDRHQIEILLDSRALDESGLLDPPITKSLRGVSLRSALQIVLDPLDLSYLVRNEVLLITPKKIADIPGDGARAVSGPAPPPDVPAEERIGEAGKPVDKAAPVPEKHRPPANVKDPFQ